MIDFFRTSPLKLQIPSTSRPQSPLLKKDLSRINRPNNEDDIAERDEDVGGGGNNAEAEYRFGGGRDYNGNQGRDSIEEISACVLPSKSYDLCLEISDPFLISSRWLKPPLSQFAFVCI